jgi:hypothetical protein
MLLDYFDRRYSVIELVQISTIRPTASFQASFLPTHTMTNNIAHLPLSYVVDDGGGGSSIGRKYELVVVSGDFLAGSRRFLLVRASRGRCRACCRRRDFCSWCSSAFDGYGCACCLLRGRTTRKQHTFAGGSWLQCLKWRRVACLCFAGRSVCQLVAWWRSCRCVFLRQELVFFQDLSSNKFVIRYNTCSARNNSLSPDTATTRTPDERTVLRRHSSSGEMRPPPSAQSALPNDDDEVVRSAVAALAVSLRYCGRARARHSAGKTRRNRSAFARSIFVVSHCWKRAVRCFVTQNSLPPCSQLFGLSKRPQSAASNASFSGSEGNNASRRVRHRDDDDSSSASLKYARRGNEARVSRSHSYTASHELIELPITLSARRAPSSEHGCVGGTFFGSDFRHASFRFCRPMLRFARLSPAMHAQPIPHVIPTRHITRFVARCWWRLALLARFRRRSGTNSPTLFRTGLY